MTPLCVLCGAVVVGLSKLARRCEECVEAVAQRGESATVPAPPDLETPT